MKDLMAVLTETAKTLGIGEIHVKNESYRCCLFTGR